MKTPICDFVNNYAKSDAARLHMPGHKGVSVLGCESLDITEITGADELFAPDGIIAESERNASRLFGADTFYSAGGSTLCIQVMLYLLAADFANGGTAKRAGSIYPMNRMLRRSSLQEEMRTRRL